MIYLVEDDSSINELVLYTLRNTGFEAEGFLCAGDFWKEMEKELPDLILLDIMLPDEDGISILKKIKSKTVTKELPVIMLTAKGTEYDKVIGLDCGADDYIPKPFGIMELIARIKAVLRRYGIKEKDSCENLSVGEISIDIKKHEVKASEQSVILTLKEFELLCYLANNIGIVLSRDMILSKVWGYDFDGESRTVDVHIRSLRQKLGKSADCIETVRGVGYKINEK